MPIDSPCGSRWAHVGNVLHKRPADSIGTDHADLIKMTEEL